MSTPEEEARRRILGEGESANYGQELLAQAQNMDPAEARKMLEATGFGVAHPREQDEYPANHSNAAFTPPPPPRDIDFNAPVDQQPMRVLSRGERRLPGGVQRGDFDEATGKRIGEFGAPAVDRWGNRVPTASDIYGGESVFSTIRKGISNMLLSPPEREALANMRNAGAEPTGSQDVPTQGEDPAADFQLVTQNDVTPEMRERQRELFRDGTLGGVSLDVDTSQPFTITEPPPGPTYPDVIDAQAALPGARRLGPDAVDVTDVSRADFTDPAQIPGNIERVVLNETQAMDSAEPGQQSASTTPELNRVRLIRGTNQSDVIVDAPPGSNLGGLEGPIGLSDADLIKFGKLNAQGIKGQDAQNLIIAQQRADSETTRATAGLLSARARGVFPVETQRGMVYARMMDNGDLSFLETDLKSVVQPQVRNFVTDDGLKTTSTPAFVWPQVDEFGRPTGGLNSVDLNQYIRGDQERQAEISNLINMALEDGYEPNEIAEQLEMRYGSLDDEE